jgi:anti-sigma-K factor RskA
MNVPADQFDDASRPPGDDIHAGEYVLGVLDAEGRREAQARMASDASFLRLVEDWEAKFAMWLARFAPVGPSPHVWPRIRTQLGWSPVATARPGLWNNTGFWRAATALAVAAGVAAVAIDLRTPPPVAPTVPAPVVVQPPPVEPATRPVTVLASDDGTTRWLASIDAAQGKVTMAPVPTPADPGGLVHELWLIAEGQAPASLGFVSNEQAHTVIVPAALRAALAAGAVLAITLEPQAGMPHAAPTGPIVAKGAIEHI